MKNLQLPLKKNWFEMTKSGIKTEDYREITPYWANRLCNKHPLSVIAGGDFRDKHTGQQFTFKKFTQNTMTLGYPKSTDTERIIKFEHKGIEIRTGNHEWGAEEGKLYFVIKHGNPINNL